MSAALCFMLRGACQALSALTDSLHALPHHCMLPPGPRVLWPQVLVPHDQPTDRPALVQCGSCQRSVIGQHPPIMNLVACRVCSVQGPAPVRLRAVLTAVPASLASQQQTRQMRAQRHTHTRAHTRTQCGMCWRLCGGPSVAAARCPSLSPTRTATPRLGAPAACRLLEVWLGQQEEPQPGRDPSGSSGPSAAAGTTAGGSTPGAGAPSTAHQPRDYREGQGVMQQQQQPLRGPGGSRLEDTDAPAAAAAAWAGGHARGGGGEGGVPSQHGSGSHGGGQYGAQPPAAGATGSGAGGGGPGGSHMGAAAASTLSSSPLDRVGALPPPGGSGGAVQPTTGPAAAFLGPEAPAAGAAAAVPGGAGAPEAPAGSPHTDASRGQPGFATPPAHCRTSADAPPPAPRVAPRLYSQAPPGSPGAAGPWQEAQPWQQQQQQQPLWQEPQPWQPLQQGQAQQQGQVPQPRQVQQQGRLGHDPGVDVFPRMHLQGGDEGPPAWGYNGSGGGGGGSQAYQPRPGHHRRGGSNGGGGSGGGHVDAQAQAQAWGDLYHGQQHPLRAGQHGSGGGGGAATPPGAGYEWWEAAPAAPPAAGQLPAHSSPAQLATYSPPGQHRAHPAHHHQPRAAALNPDMDWQPAPHSGMQQRPQPHDPTSWRRHSSMPTVSSCGWQQAAPDPGGSPPHQRRSASARLDAAAGHGGGGGFASRPSPFAQHAAAAGSTVGAMADPTGAAVHGPSSHGGREWSRQPSQQPPTLPQPHYHRNDDRGFGTAGAPGSGSGPAAWELSRPPRNGDAASLAVLQWRNVDGGPRAVGPSSSGQELQTAGAHSALLRQGSGRGPPSPAAWGGAPYQQDSGFPGPAEPWESAGQQRWQQQPRPMHPPNATYTSQQHQQHPHQHLHQNHKQYGGAVGQPTLPRAGHSAISDLLGHRPQQRAGSSAYQQPPPQPQWERSPPGPGQRHAPPYGTSAGPASGPATAGVVAPAARGSGEWYGGGERFGAGESAAAVAMDPAGAAGGAWAQLQQQQQQWDPAQALQAPAGSPGRGGSAGGGAGGAAKRSSPKGRGPGEGEPPCTIPCLPPAVTDLVRTAPAKVAMEGCWGRHTFPDHMTGRCTTRGACSSSMLRCRPWP